jgi:ketosteroid isomerase-like protein
VSQENLEAVRRIYEGWMRGDFTVGADLFAPVIEFSFQFGVDNAHVWGTEAMSRVWADQLSNWAEWQTGEIEELREVGDSVIAFSSVRGVGKRSGITVEMPDAACLFTFRDGKVVRLFPADSRRVVLEAVGLQE